MRSPPAADANAAVVPSAPGDIVAPPSGRCPNCTGPIEATDAFCPSCGTTLKSTEVPRGETSPEPPPVEAALGRAFRCESCGAQVHCEPDSRSTTCPFCAAPYVLEIDPSQTGKQDPEFVLGFAVPPDEADKIYRQWVARGGIFRPGDLAAQARADGLKGIYLPFWSFSCRADSTWSARIGEHWYRTETYTERDANGNTVTKTRQVQETEWWDLSGGHHAYHSFYLVSGSKGLDQATFERIQPFPLLGLKRYRPQFLAGWLSEDYSVDREAAYPRSEAEFRRREEAAIAGFLPGDTYSGLNVDVRFSEVNSDLILLPIYLRSYRYRGKLYRTLINGQTGKVWGQKPVSGVRVGGFVAGLLLLALVLWLLISFLSR